MEGIRTFQCRLAGTDQPVEIVNVLVHHEKVHLVVVNKTGRKWVFEIPANGFKVAHPHESREVLALHEAEMLKLGVAKEAVSSGR